MPRERFGAPEPLLIAAEAAATAEDSKVHTSGDVLVSQQSLGFGGIRQAMDVYQKAQGHADEEAWELREGQSWLGGWGSPFCTIIRARWDDSGLKPTGLDRRRWDNSNGITDQHYEVSLTKSVEEKDSVAWDTKLSVSDTISVGIEADLPGVGKASASNSLTIGAEVGRSWSHERTVTAGTSDGTSADLKPGQAELVLLSALKGPLNLIVEMQTRWEGTIYYKRPGGTWQELDLAVLQDHGLARPLDVHGIHAGLITLTLSLGTVSEVDITSIGVTDTSEAGWDAAENGVLSARFPDRMGGADGVAGGGMGIDPAAPLALAYADLQVAAGVIARAQAQVVGLYAGDPSPPPGVAAVARNLALAEEDAMRALQGVAALADYNLTPGLVAAAAEPVQSILATVMDDIDKAGACLEDDACSSRTALVAVRAAKTRLADAQRQLGG